MNKAEALIEAQKLLGMSNVALLHGMLSQNELRKYCGQPPAYSSEAFELIGIDLYECSDNIIKLASDL